MNGIPVTVVASSGSNGRTTVSTIAEPGNELKVSFDGPVLINSPQLPGGQIRGYVSGSFEAFRNN